MATLSHRPIVTISPNNPVFDLPVFVARDERLFEDAGIIERHDFRNGRARYEQMAANRVAGGRTVTSGRVWVLDDTGRPRSVDVRIGLTDGTYSEVIGGTLQEGSQVIVGLQADAKARTQAKGGPRFGF